MFLFTHSKFCVRPTWQRSCRVHPWRGNLLAVVFLASFLPAFAAGAQPSKGAPQEPEFTTSIEQKTLVSARRYMVTAAHPLAVQAGEAILAKGGSAVDAAIAVQLMLGLVEPQSSGLGGGLFLLHFDQKTKRLTSIDGRETAPSAAGPDLFRKQGQLQSWREAYVGGNSVGVPGTFKALELAHQKYGKLPWKDLFESTIETAEKGFVVSPRLAAALAAQWNLALSEFDSSRAYFKPNGQWLQAGERLKNPAYGALLRQVAQNGSAAFYQGENAKALVQAVQTARKNPGLITEQDLRHYSAKEREALCLSYRTYQVCSMAPPSSGGLTVLQILGLLADTALPTLKPNSLEAVHLISQASKLAFADRDRYIADPDFVSVPVEGLLAPSYLKERAKLLAAPAAQLATAGLPKGAQAQASSEAIEFANTSHFSIVDSYGNAASVTTTIENGFGSGVWVNGYLLNNQLTDFSLEARQHGLWVANRIEGKKRPRSSMAPVMVFDSKGELYYITGSPGGSRIINYVAQNLIAVLDWGLDPAQAAALPRFSHRNDALVLEQGTDLEHLVPKLKALGHAPKLVDLNSGIHAIERKQGQLRGAADPRREGSVAGE